MPDWMISNPTNEVIRVLNKCTKMHACMYVIQMACASAYASDSQKTLYPTVVIYPE